MIFHEWRFLISLQGLRLSQIEENDGLGKPVSPGAAVSEPLIGCGEFRFAVLKNADRNPHHPAAAPDYSNPINTDTK